MNQWRDGIIHLRGFLMGAIIMICLLLIGGSVFHVDAQWNGSRTTKPTREANPYYEKIICPHSKSLIYNFKSVTLIGNKIHSGSVSKSRHLENVFSGKIVLSCQEQEENNHLGNVILISFLESIFEQFQGIGRSKRYRKIISRTDLTDQLNVYPVFIVQSSSGHIYRLIFNKKEQPYLKIMKKGILRLLTTETRRNARHQTDGFGGKYFQEYKKSLEPNKPRMLNIYQEFSTQNFVTKIPISKRKLNYNVKHLVLLDLNNHWISSASLLISLNHQQRSISNIFDEFEKLSKRSGLQENNEFRVSDQSCVESGSFSTITFSKVVNLTTLSMENFRIINSTRNTGWLFENTFSSRKLDRKNQKKMNRGKFSPDYFKSLLYLLKINPPLSHNTTRLVGILTNHRKHDPIQSANILFGQLLEGIQYIRRLNGSDLREYKSYLETIQNLIAVTRNQNIQEKLVALSSTEPILANNYIYSSILINNPCQKTFSFIRHLKRYGLKQIYPHITIEENDIFKRNAYLSFTDLAHRLRNPSLKIGIVREILDNIENSESLEEMENQFHALNNAGGAVDPALLYSFWASNNVPEYLKILLTKNIRKRTRDDPKLDNVLVRIVRSSNDIFSPSLKISIIEAQSEREHTLNTWSLLKPLSTQYHTIRNVHLKNAIRKYMHSIGSETSAKHLSKMMNKKRIRKNNHLHYKKFGLTQEDLDILQQVERKQNTLFLGGFMRKIQDGFSQHKENIVNVVRRSVDEGIRKASSWVESKAAGSLSKINQAIGALKQSFAVPATIQNEQSCIQVSINVNDTVCFYNTDMITFFQKQGDLSNMKFSKHFEFEKIAGPKAVNLYCGMSIYSGTSFDCNADKSYFDFVLITRAAFEASALQRKFSLLELSAEITKRPHKQVRDNIYLRIAQTTFVNTGFVPEQVKRVISVCTSESRPIFEKTFPVIATHEQLVNIGPIPLVFHISISMSVGVELVFGLCVERLEASASIEPYVSVSLTGGASLGIPIARAGMYIRSTLTYRLVPRLAFEKCNLCASLQHKVDSLEFQIGLNAKVLTFDKFWKFYGKTTRPFVKTIFEKCIPLFGSPTVSIKSKDTTFDLKTIEEIGSTTTHKQVITLQDENTAQENQYPSEVIDGYKPLFGINAMKIPDMKLPQEDKESLLPPPTEQPEEEWKLSFIKTEVPPKIIEKIGLENLRRLSTNYFKLTIEERNKIPYEVYYLPKNDFTNFISKFSPSSLLRNTNISPDSYEKVWRRDVLQERLPSNILDQVPLKILRTLPEPILRLRIGILKEIPPRLFKDGFTQVKSWVCLRYEKLCSLLNNY